jgi:hypothetical protein
MKLVSRIILWFQIVRERNKLRSLRKLETEALCHNPGLTPTSRSVYACYMHKLIESIEISKKKLGGLMDSWNGVEPDDGHEVDPDHWTLPVSGVYPKPGSYTDGKSEQEVGE